MATASHIDLGELTHRPYEPAGSGPGWWRHSAIPLRVWLAAVVGAVTLVGLGSAAAPAAGLTELLTVPVSTFWLDYQVDDDRLYVIDQPERSGPHRLTAHPLTSDVAGWQIALPGEHAALVNSSVGPALLVRQHGSEPALLNIDPTDGSIRWRLATSLIEATDETLLLYAPPPVHGHWSGLLAADSASGEVRWQVAEVRWAWVLDPARVLLIGAHGELTVHDLQSGEPLVQSRPAESIVGAWVVDGSVLMPHPPVDHNGVRGLGDALSAFDSRTLAHRWSIDLSREDAAFLRAASHCGRWLCLLGATVWAVDPATGAEIWRSKQEPESTRLSETWFERLPPSHPLAELVHLPGFEDMELLLDAETGAVRQRLTEWSLLPDRDPAAPVRVVRYGDDERPTWLGQLRPDWSGVEPVAALGGRYEHCVTDHGYLVCGPQSGRINTGELTVWRFALP